MAAHKTHHVAKYKKRIVDEFKDLIKEYPIIATINMENMPTAQLQKMRGQLRGKVVLLMSKRRIMKIAIEESKSVKKGVEELNKYLKGMPALMFTKENPFKLYKMLERNKTNAPAKPGQIAPKDILIKAGATPFAPGPVISELSMIGLKTGVEGGKVAIKEDKVVVKEGEKINDKVASMLLRLGITPMEIGMDLVAAYENGTIFTKDVLAIDEKEFMQRLIAADSEAFNLGVEIKYPAVRILEYLIGKAFNDSKALVLGQNIMCSLVAEDLLSKAEREMLSLKESANITDVVKEEAKAEVKEEEPIKKEEEKREEPKKVEEKPKEEPKAEVKEEEPIEKKEEPIKKEEKVIEKPEIKEEKAIETKPMEKEPIKEKAIEEKPIEKEEVKVEEKAEIIKKEPVKEEIKKEEVEEEKREEPKVEEKPEPTTEDRVKKMVEAQRKKAAGIKEPTADDILKDVKQEDIEKEAKKADESRAIAEEIVNRIQKGEKINKEDIPSIQELAEKEKKKRKKKS